MRDEVLQGLQDSRKELPSKYFYDEVGSQLFEQICELDEYYFTRTELSIMHEMVSLLGPHCLLIEYGSGSSTKIRMLLDALQDPTGYVPIDIAKEQLLQSVTSLALAYPELEVLPVCADYTSNFKLPLPGKPVLRRVAYFPGSTIATFHREPAKHFLHPIPRASPSARLLLRFAFK